MQHLKLATIGVVYSVSMILLRTSIGVVFFRESLNYYEITGIVLAVASLVLLVRFAQLGQCGECSAIPDTVTAVLLKG